MLFVMPASIAQAQNRDSPETGRAFLESLLSPDGEINSYINLLSGLGSLFGLGLIYFSLLKETKAKVEDIEKKINSLDANQQKSSRQIEDQIKEIKSDIHLRIQKLSGEDIKDLREIVEKVGSNVHTIKNKLS